MAEIDRYRLTLLFDTSQISPDDLDQRARAALLKHLPTVELRLEPIDPGRVELSIVGSLEDVDACHEKLNAELFDRHYCVRLLDEPGDEIRRQAYPILAQIEQSLRAFINRAMTEVIGFDWWDHMTPPALQRSVEEIEKKVGQPSAIHHPVELTYFEQLLGMVTASLQQWTEQKPLSVVDFAELLSNCHSIEEIRTKLAEKTRKISLWDEVFARYFEEKDAWSELEKQINQSVIPARNKVMHHRPIRLYELRDLSNTQESLCALLLSARPQLPQEERVEAREVGMELIDMIRRQQDPLAQLRQAMLEAFRQQESELARQRQQSLDAMLEPIRTLQEQMERATERLMEPPTSQADLGEEGDPMTYRVYENWTVRPDKAIVHRSDCPYANGGPIPSPTKNGQWHGPFATYQQALEAAEGTGRREVRGCKHCNPP